MFVWFINVGIFLSQKMPLRSIAHIRGTFLNSFFHTKNPNKMGLIPILMINLFTYALHS